MSHWKISILALALPLILTAPVAAGESGVSIDPKADQILKQMSDYLGNLRQFTFKSTNTIDLVVKNGQKITLFSSSKSTVRRPDGLKTERLGKQNKLQLFFDGQTATLFDPNGNHFAQREFTGDLYEVLDYLRDYLEIEMPAADLVYPNVYKGLMETAESGTYVGAVELDGVLCHHLAFRAEDVDWQLWVEAGDRPVPRRYAMFSKWITGSPQFAVLFQEWELPSTVPDSMFHFKVPESAKRVVFEEREQ
jgi:hypothetical protein